MEKTHKNQINKLVWKKNATVVTMPVYQRERIINKRDCSRKGSEIELLIK